MNLKNKKKTDLHFKIIYKYFFTNLNFKLGQMNFNI